MSDRYAKKAEALFREGYNCAQSVFGAFHEILGLDFETALKLAAPFVGGMGRLREVCGAVSGMLMAAGVRYGYSDPTDGEAKKAHYALVQHLAHTFREQNHSIICRELLGLPKGEDTPAPKARTANYYAKRPCVQLVACAAGILGEILEKEEVNDS